MNLLRRCVASILLAPMLVLAISAFGFIGQRCRMTGMVSLDECCGGASDDQPPAQSSIGEPGCCERVVVANVKPTAAPPAATDDDLRLDGLTLPQTTAGGAAAEAPRAIAAAAPPHLSRPPLHLLKRSLLI
jgi:hypothetical protein